jgi:hypothetical protein
VDVGEKILECRVGRVQRQIQQRPEACRATAALRPQIPGPERKTGNGSEDVVGSGRQGMMIPMVSTARFASLRSSAEITARAGTIEPSLWM